MDEPIGYVKSKQRVADHGEVFTPPWLVEAMLDLVKDETQRIAARFLEPACGSGNFLVAILRRKLAAVELKYAPSSATTDAVMHGSFGLSAHSCTATGKPGAPAAMSVSVPPPAKQIPPGIW